MFVSLFALIWQRYNFFKILNQITEQNKKSLTSEKDCTYFKYLIEMEVKPKVT